MTQEEREKVTAEVLRRFGSIYAFCRVAGLNRSTVWAVLKGKYYGNEERQGRRILQALGEQLGELEQIYHAIREVACGRCSVSNSSCNRCERLFRDQADSVARALGLEGTWRT